MTGMNSRTLENDATDKQVLNNRLPDVERDFGITDEEDRLDQELMPDTTNQQDIAKQNHI